MAMFSLQMGMMVEAYMAWSSSQKIVSGNGVFDSDERCTREEERRKCDNVHTTLFSVLVLDIFCESLDHFKSHVWVITTL